jgi:dicarboxylate/amino acid:cation (Na+ or H+) symporter, DAACS family
MDRTNKKRGLALPTRILLGLLVGGVAGIALNLWLAPGQGQPPGAGYARVLWFADNVAWPVGQVFLRLLFMVVVPVVFCSLFLGVAGLGSLATLGRLGSRTLLWFLGTTTLATCIGVFLVSTLQPGRQMSQAVAAQVKAQYMTEAAAKIALSEQRKSTIDTFLEIVPTNVVASAADNKQVLGLIFFALILGAAAMRLPNERLRVLRELLETVFELCVKVLGWTMLLAPFGVAGLIFHATAKLGFDVMKLVGWYFATAMAGLVIYQAVVVTALAWVFGGVRPGRFYRGIKLLVATAFSTSSSNATMPTTLATAVDEFAVPREIAGFVVPLGATMNMNGTALFEGVSVLFLAQVAGVPLDVGQQILVVAMAVLMAIGAAGVPGGSLPLIAVVLTRVGVPAEMLALILGVDRLVDMTRTVPNVCSDLVCSLWLSRKERGRLPH